MNAHDVIQRPLVTEKSNIGREDSNLATFAVAAPSAVQGLRYTRDGRHLVAKLYGGRLHVRDEGGRRPVRTIRGGRDLGPFDLDPGGAGPDAD